MRDWRVRIAEGTLRRLTEDEFVLRAREASDAMIRDQLTKISQLKQRIYTQRS
jgi:hypothetical protein